MNDTIGVQFESGKLASVEQIEASNAALLAILNSNNDQKTKCLALECLRAGITASAASHINLSGLSVDLAKPIACK